MLELLKKEGLETKIERGNRVFPVTDNAESVVDALYRRLKKQKVEIITSAKVTGIKVEDKKVKKVEYLLNNVKKEILADKVILATGGASYKETGSNRRWL